MPRRPKFGQLEQPYDYAVNREEWPRGPLRDNAPKEARLAKGIAEKILDQIDKNNTTPHAVAMRLGIGRQTLYNVLDGRSWPNFITVARLEIHFNRRLWGAEHKPKRYKAAETT